MEFEYLNDGQLKSYILTFYLKVCFYNGTMDKLLRLASFSPKYFCNGGIKYRIRPLKAIATPARMKAGSYFPVKSYKAP